MALSRGSKGFLAFCLVAVLGVGGGLLYLDGRLGGPDVEPGQDVEVVVEQGQSLRAVGDDLTELGVIRSGMRFRSIASDAELDRRLQPGEYDMVTGMDAEEVVEALLAGPARSAGVRFTIQEGLPTEVILERLDEQFEAYALDEFRAVLEERTAADEDDDEVLRLPDWAPEPAEAGQEIIEPFEGLLYPETYEVDRDASPRRILQLMVDQGASVMQAVIDDVGVEERSPYELLVEASLVEREARVDEERPRVAGVIQNRLDDGMRLQVDATVLYARGEHTDRVLFDDTDIDSPYNTYQADGLPPAPIASPGSAALRAAAQPERHDFRFYVLSPACDGTHQFAEDLDQHNRYVAELREVDGCR